MLSVQLEPFSAQIQTIQSSSQQTQINDSPSFMELLRSADEEIKSKDNSEEPEKIAEKNPQKLEETEKDGADETPVQNEYGTIAELAGITESQTDKTENISEIQVLNPEAGTAETEKAISLEQIQWLKTPVLKNGAEANEDAEISAQDFAALIDSAVEFIPGEALEQEKLENAQNLSVNDPQFFLEKSENIQDVKDLDLTQNIQEKIVPEQLTKSDDVKTEDPKKDKKTLKVEVTDLRTQKIQENSTELKVEKGQAKKDFNLSYKRENENTVQVTLDLASTVNQNITSSADQSAGANGSVFQSMLTNAITQNAADFVKSGNIVLKDNNQGNINLIVHPEKLGNVKISLNLNDRVISGSITVHSQEAYEALKDSIASLKNAFASGGFETGEFNLNFSSQNQQFAQERGNEGQNPGNEIFANRAYGEYSAEGAVALSQNLQTQLESSVYSVNIVA